MGEVTCILHMNKENILFHSSSSSRSRLIQDLVTSAGAHGQTEVFQVVVDGRDMPLVGALIVFISSASNDIDIVSGLVPFVGEMCESLVHGGVHDHVLVVGHSTEVGDSVRAIFSELIVTNTRASVVKHPDIGDTPVDKVECGKGCEGSAKTVASNNHRVGRVLLFQKFNLAQHIINDILFGSVKTIVDLTSIAVGVGGQFHIQIINPILNTFTSSKRHVNGTLTISETHVAMCVMRGVVDRVSCDEAFQSTFVGTGQVCVGATVGVLRVPKRESTVVPIKGTRRSSGEGNSSQEGRKFHSVSERVDSVI